MSPLAELSPGTARNFNLFGIHVGYCDLHSAEKQIKFSPSVLSAFRLQYDSGLEDRRGGDDPHISVCNYLHELTALRLGAKDGNYCRRVNHH